MAPPEDLLEWVEQAKAEIKRRDTKCDELKVENQELRLNYRLPLA